MAINDGAIPTPTSVSEIINKGGQGQKNRNISFATFLASLSTALVIFGFELLAFFLLKGKFAQIYAPKTFLAAKHERVVSERYGGAFRWIKPLFQVEDQDVIDKCGLDAFMFLRYLRMLLKIFVPLACVILPILLPINRSGNSNDETSGLDTFGWQNMGTKATDRFWAHLTLAVMVIAWVCYNFYHELLHYVRIRQAHLTSEAHRVLPSATTVLISNVPPMYLSVPVLTAMFDKLPGGVRRIWLNRNIDKLARKVDLRKKIARKLEVAEFDLIKKCVKKAKKMKELEERQLNSRQSKSETQVGSDHPDKGTDDSECHEIGNPFAELQSSTEPDNATSPAAPKRPLFSPRDVTRKLGQAGQAIGGGVAGGLKKTAQGITGMFEPTHRVYGMDPDLARQSNSSFYNPHSARNSFDPQVSPIRERANSDTALPVAASTDPNRSSSRPYASDLAIDMPFHRPETSIGTVRHLQGDQFVSRDHNDGSGNDSDEDGQEKIHYYNPEFDPSEHPELENNAVWRKYLEPKERDTMYVPLVDRDWFPSIPFVGKKVDTIYWCRKRLADLNVEIEQDQLDAENFVKQNSAFIQFNNQIAAHIACQSLAHHLPRSMAPRVVEIAPNDIIWDNLSITWWEKMVRSFLVLATIAGIIIAWAFPTTFTGLLSQVTYLTEVFPWLGWIERLPKVVIAMIQGALPPLFLAILLALLPLMLRWLARFEGFASGMLVELRVQNYFFAFLFIQVFLVVSISSGVGSTIEGLVNNPLSVPQTLAENLPKASNYFFSYMILQALTVSAGALMQFGSLFQVFILAPILDKTPREKWTRKTKLPEIQWGTFFPVYTNLAAIGLVYSVITPLILIFNIITFSLFWIVYRYQTLYVVRFKFDSGGLMFPRAINQLFTGLYVMELCLIGLFFLVRDSNNRAACTPQAVIMIVCFFLTIIFQISLHNSFRGLFHYVPLTGEEEFKKVFEQIREQEVAEAIAHVGGLESGSADALGGGNGGSRVDMNADANGTHHPPPPKKARTSMFVQSEDFDETGKDLATKFQIRAKIEEAENKMIQAWEEEKVRRRKGSASGPPSHYSKSMAGSQSNIAVTSALSPPAIPTNAGTAAGHQHPTFASTSRTIESSGMSQSKMRGFRNRVSASMAWHQRSPGAESSPFGGEQYNQYPFPDIEAQQPTLASPTGGNGQATINNPHNHSLGRNDKPVDLDMRLQTKGPVIGDLLYASTDLSPDSVLGYRHVFGAGGTVRSPGGTTTMAIPVLSAQGGPSGINNGAGGDASGWNNNYDWISEYFFTHEALRVLRPYIWIPKDPYGISKDEIEQTRLLAGDNIWIGTRGAGLNKDGDVLLSGPPQDWDRSEVARM